MKSAIIACVLASLVLAADLAHVTVGRTSIAPRAPAHENTGQRTVARSRVFANSPAGSIPAPSVQWDWDGLTRAADTFQVYGTPVVVQLNDDNGDGRVDESDTPDVAFLHGKDYPSFVTALDGSTGDELFTTGAPEVWQTLAAGDIDNDGHVELVSVVASSFPDPKLQVAAFDHTGALKWKSWPAPATPGFLYWHIGIADLDQDGNPEIFAGANVFDNTGKLLWVGSAGQGSVFYGGVNAVDLIPESPGLELLAGNTVYDPKGNVLWTDPELPDGLTAVADFNGDGLPEIVLIEDFRENMYLLDHEGTQLGHYQLVGGYLSKPLVADMDGDGEPEVFLASALVVEALDWTGMDFAVKWTYPTYDLAGRSQSTAFDFDGDGAAEIVFRNEEGWMIFDGATGSVDVFVPFPSATFDETPVVADIDNDGLAEVVVASIWDTDHLSARGAIVAWEYPAPNRPRAVWNEFFYHVCNVNEDGTIPQFEAPSWLLHNSWIGQAGPGDCLVDEDEDGDEGSDGGSDES